MSTPQRRQPVAVVHQLLEEPHRFGFFQAVRLLERWFMRHEALHGGLVLGRRLQFRNSLSLGFPASEIAAFKVVSATPQDIDLVLPIDATPETGDDTGLLQALRSSRTVGHIEITPAFVGLLGAGGALPIFYTELLTQREAYDKDTGARAFLDVFLHRAVVLFYEAWRKHRLPIQFETDRRNRFLPLMLSVSGVGHPALRDRLKARAGGVADDTLAFFGGLLQQGTVSAAVLQRMVAHYFKVPVRVYQFVGRWFTMPTGNQTRLGLTNGQLGGNALSGERVWQRDLRMRLTLGPMSREKLRRFLPGGPGALALRELLTMLTGVSLEYEIRLSLRAEDVQGVRLADDTGPRLGWDGFLVTRPAAEDRSDAGYDIHSLA